MTEEFTPTIVSVAPSGTRVTFMLALPTCPACKRPMLLARKGGWAFENLPRWGVNAWREQCKRGDLGVATEKTYSAAHRSYLCEDCVAADKGVFSCALCEQERSIRLLKEAIGDPPSCVCTVCYETVPAMLWEDRIDELQRVHQHDYD